jgi:hypothetical protein
VIGLSQIFLKIILCITDINFSSDFRQFLLCLAFFKEKRFIGKISIGILGESLFENCQKVFEVELVPRAD